MIDRKWIVSELRELGFSNYATHIETVISEHAIAERTIERMAAKIETLEAERDAVRKALEWMYRRREVAFVGDTLEHCLAVSDGTGASIEAALLAAASEGGGQ